MKILETERLILRKIKTSDAPFLLQLFNDPSFIQNIRDKKIRTIEQAALDISNNLTKSYETFGFGLYLVELKNNQAPIGICGLVKRESLDDVDIGFAFMPKFWNKGYAVESANGVLEFSKKTLGLKRIVGITLPHNHASSKVLEKIGLKFEQMIRLGDDNTENKLFGLTFTN